MAKSRSTFTTPYSSSIKVTLFVIIQPSHADTAVLNTVSKTVLSTMQRVCSTIVWTRRPLIVPSVMVMFKNISEKEKYKKWQVMIGAAVMILQCSS